jgi:hypothetical protein
MSMNDHHYLHNVRKSSVYSMTEAKSAYECKQIGPSSSSYIKSKVKYMIKPQMDEEKIKQKYIRNRDFLK